MDVQTRIVLCSLLNKMDDQENFSEFIGLENRSRFLGHGCNHSQHSHQKNYNSKVSGQGRR